MWRAAMAKLREILDKLAAGDIDAEKAEQDILGDCEDVEPVEAPDDDDE